MNPGGRRPVSRAPGLVWNRRDWRCAVTMAGLKGTVEKFPSCRIAVIGDLIADEYVTGRPVRLSREAPIPILRYESTRIVPGGAANTVNNAAVLGATVLPLGIVGRDSMGAELVRLLKAAGADAAGIIEDPGMETVVKTRILGGDVNTVRQQVARIDRDAGFAPSAKGRASLDEALTAAVERIDVLVVSDYGYRTVSEGTAGLIRRFSRKIRIIVDSHDRIAEFKGAYGAVPNESEAATLAALPINCQADALRAGEKIMAQMGFGFLLMTRGNQGMVLFEPGYVPRVIPISGSNDITDVSGAGDTVTALVALGLSSGASAYDTAQIANHGAGVVVMKRGTATVSRAELLGAIAKRADEGKPAGAQA